MQEKFIFALDGVPVRRFDDPHFNDLTNKVQGTVNRITYFTVHVIGLVSETFGTVAVFYVAARIRWYFPLIALAMMAIRFAVDQQIGRRITDSWHEIMPAERKRSYFHGRCWAGDRMLHSAICLRPCDRVLQEMRKDIPDQHDGQQRPVSLALDTTSMPCARLVIVHDTRRADQPGRADHDMADRPTARSQARRLVEQLLRDVQLHCRPCRPEGGPRSVRG